MLTRYTGKLSLITYAYAEYSVHEGFQPFVRNASIKSVRQDNQFVRISAKRTCLSASAYVKSLQGPTWGPAGSRAALTRLRLRCWLGDGKTKR